MTILENLKEAAEEGEVKRLQSLLDVYGHTQECEKWLKQTALITAMCQGNVRACETVKVLIQAGADVNPQGSSMFPIHRAVSSKEGVKLIEILVEAGAHVEAQNSTLETPLMLSVNYSNLEMIKKLLECGANPDFRYSYTLVDFKGCSHVLKKGALDYALENFIDGVNLANTYKVKRACEVFRLLAERVKTHEVFFNNKKTVWQQVLLSYGMLEAVL